jgi:tetratricopeptide (TPR) repeat protein
MRARFGVAVCLRDLGKISEALDHMRALLHLNPSDNQGVRYMLMEGLLESGADEEIGALLTRYKTDASAVFCYTQALWMFRRLGPVKSAGASLAKAVAANPHVPGFLLKRIKLPKQAPKTISPGSFEEAESYAMHGIAVWQKTIGAVEWLTANAPGDAKPK